MSSAKTNTSPKGCKMNCRIDTTKEFISSTAGSVLCGQVFCGIGLERQLDHFHRGNAVKAMFGLLVHGRSRYAEINMFRHDRLFRDAFGLPKVPAQETLRLYFEQIQESHADAFCRIIDHANAQLLGRAKLTAVNAGKASYIPVDVDATVFDNSGSKKEQVSFTYKKVFGYTPNFAHIGAEGYILHNELRKGSQHCSKGAPEFLLHCRRQLEKLTLESPLLWRLDSGYDAITTLKELKPDFFIVKRNLRHEKSEEWLEIAQKHGELLADDAERRVRIGIHRGRCPASDEQFGPVDILYVVTEILQDKGTPLLQPEIEVDTFWTNLDEKPLDILKLYHDHGTSEQFHSELKTDMDFERLPSGKFGVNALLLHLAMVAFNTLRLIGQQTLELRELLPYRHGKQRKRLRKVISDIIRISCKVVSHSRQTILRFWEKEPWYKVFARLHERLDKLW